MSTTERLKCQSLLTVRYFASNIVHCMLLPSKTMKVQLVGLILLKMLTYIFLYKFWKTHFLHRIWALAKNWKKACWQHRDWLIRADIKHHAWISKMSRIFPKDKWQSSFLINIIKKYIPLLHEIFLELTAAVSQILFFIEIHDITLCQIPTRRKRIRNYLYWMEKLLNEVK